MPTNREKQIPNLKAAKSVLDRESSLQKTRPENDIFQDQMDDEGQDLMDELAAQENLVDFPEDLDADTLKD